MARRTQSVDVQDAALAGESAGRATEFLSAFAPLLATWCATTARMVALVRGAETARAAALTPEAVQ
jgi:hypothetical protein